MKKQHEKMGQGGDDIEKWREREMTRLKEAKAVTEVSDNLWVAEIIGSDVRNRDNEDLGEVTDVIIDPKNGEIAYAIVTHGGFLGLGEDEVAVPWKRLHVTQDFDVVVLDMTEEQLEEAPEVDRDDRGHIKDPKWREQTEIYYRDRSDKKG